MTRARVFPHRRIVDDALAWGAWVVSRDAAPAVELGERLESWDYATPAAFGLTVDLEAVGALEESSRLSRHCLDVVVLVDCAASGVRLHAVRALDEVDGGPPVMVDVPAGVLADRVRLSAHVVLRSTQEADGTRATRPGARLAEAPPKTVVLEGDLHRFPTEAVSFAALRLEQAAWTVRVRFTSLDDSFVGAVRLLINTDHPASSALLDVKSSQSRALHSFLRLDVARQLLLAVAAERDIDLADGLGAEADDGTLRAGLEALSETFLSMDLAAAVQMARQDRGRFERSLQVGVEFLKDVDR